MKIVNGLVSETTSKANLLIAGVFQNQKTPPAALSTTDSEAFRLAKRALEKKRFIGTQREVFTTDREALTQAEALALIGLGKPEEWNPGSASHVRFIRPDVFTRGQSGSQPKPFKVLRWRWPIFTN